MENINKNGYVSKVISNVCNGRNEAELKEAEYNFTKYLMVVKDISERLIKEEKCNYFFDEISNKG